MNEISFLLLHTMSYHTIPYHTMQSKLEHESITEYAHRIIDEILFKMRPTKRPPSPAAQWATHESDVKHTNENHVVGG